MRADTRIAGWLSQVSLVVRRVAGMPCYPDYVQHLKRCHPDRPIPSEAEYFDAYVTARYSAGASRCC